MTSRVEIIQQVREIPGVAGVHIMAVEWEDAVKTIVEKAGLLPRPVIKSRGKHLLAQAA